MRASTGCSAFVLTRSRLKPLEAETTSVYFIPIVLYWLFPVSELLDVAAGFPNNTVIDNLFGGMILIGCAALLFGMSYVPILSLAPVPKISEASGWSVVPTFTVLPVTVGEVACRLVSSGRTSTSEGR